MWNYNYQRSNELYHHGVKGMKWGVRHDPSKSNITKRSASYGKDGRMWNNSYYNNGKFTAKGRKRYRTVKNYKRNYNYDRAIKVLGAAAAVGGIAYLASPAGRPVVMMGKTWFDAKMKPGTLVQNIAPIGRDFSTSFYGSRDLQTRQFFLKQFTQHGNPKFKTPPRNVATMFVNDKELKIAGRKQMDIALKEAAKKQFESGRSHANQFKYNASSVDGIVNLKTMPVKTFRQRTDFWRKYGELSEESRKEINDVLVKKGYQGFKDVNDMMIDWGKTPTVFFGKDSGLRELKRVNVNVSKAKKMKVNLKLGQVRAERIMRGGGSTLAYTSLGGASLVAEKKDKENISYKLFDKPYKDLTPTQKAYYNKYYKMDLVSRREEDKKRRNRS